MRHSLRFKLTMAYIALAIVCTFTLGAAGLRLQQQTYLANLNDRLNVEVDLAADTVVKAMGLSQPLGPVVDRIAALTGARVTVIDPSGTVLADSVLDAGQAEDHATRPEFVAALAGGQGTAQRTSASSGEPTSYVARPLLDQGQVRGAVRIGLPLTEIDQNLARILAAVAGLTLLGAIITALMTLLVTRVLTVPLRELTTLVRQATAGHLSERLPIRSRDEFGQLAASYNQMADQLDRTFQTTMQQRNELSTILAGISDGILIVDQQQRIVRINRTALELFGVGEPSAIGRQLIEVSRDHELVSIVSHSLRDQQLARQVIERSQAPRALSVTSAPISAGDLTGALVTLHDVSELRRLEAVRRQFVANVSHELRTPLSTIKLMVETLQEDPSDVALVDDFLGRINAEIDSLTQMVRELLELSKLESGQAPLERSPVALGRLVDSVLQRLGPQAQRGGVLLAASPAVHDTLPLIGDADRLEGVLVNLVHNAIKFTPPGGAVTVGVHGDGDEAIVWVRDTGIGIAPSDADRIFERFYKADKARTSGGTGLGLAIAKHTIQAHGGRIWVESRPGQGSTFLFTLPLAARPQEAAALASP